jgi:pimeloyl-ACP methyl ester carboxylesterase
MVPDHATATGFTRTRPLTRASAILCSLVLLILVGSCAQMPSTGITTIQFTDDKQSGTKELQSESVQTQVVERRLGVDQFKLRGPFEVNTRNGEMIRLSAKERIPADFYLSSLGNNAPLVILLHGYNNGKADHAYQGMHLATWGINCVVLQLPNRGSWIGHGRTLARIVNHIQKRPGEFTNIDTRRIILVGHSFGASSVVNAMGQGATASGAILLDPASFGSGLPAALGRVNRPVTVIGADEEIFPARGRELFFRHIRENVGELSIRNAGHEDAQFKLSDDGSREGQLAFISALTAAVISISSTNRFDFAWQSYEPAISSGRFFDVKKK